MGTLTEARIYGRLIIWNQNTWHMMVVCDTNTFGQHLSQTLLWESPELVGNRLVIDYS